MSDPRVNQWRQQGKLYLWRNPRSTRGYPGWDCACDESGRRSLLELFDLLLVAEFNAKRMISVAPLDREIARLPGPPVTTNFFSASKITLIHPRTDIAPDYFRWSGDQLQPVLTVGRDKLAELKQAFEQLAEFGDFCVHVDDQKLHGYEFEKGAIWFWQLFDTTVTRPRHVPRGH